MVLEALWITINSTLSCLCIDNMYIYLCLLPFHLSVDLGHLGSKRRVTFVKHVKILGNVKQVLYS
jgi:hypothetical protein